MINGGNINPSILPQWRPAGYKGIMVLTRNKDIRLFRIGRRCPLDERESLPLDEREESSTVR